jgi:hypothetical protein
VLYRAAASILVLNSLKIRTETKEQFEAMMYLRNDLPVSTLQPNVLLPFMLKVHITVATSLTAFDSDLDE